MLEKLAVHHVLWLQILNNLGCEDELAKDLVQDMYVRLHRLVKNEQDIMYFNDVNKFFVYKVLKNLYLSAMKKDSKYHFTELESQVLVSKDYDESEDAYFENLLDDIKDYVNEWDTHDKALFNLYFGVIIDKGNRDIDKTRSLREVAKKCNLGLTSIHQQVKGYKSKLYEEFREDIEDYFNKDFDI